eukprot:1157152-Pelagomonas_calceolata.AAC.1
MRGCAFMLAKCTCFPSFPAASPNVCICAQVAVEQAAQEKRAGDVRLDVKDGPAGLDTKTEAKMEGGGPVKMEQD